MERDDRSKPAGDARGRPQARRYVRAATLLLAWAAAAVGWTAATGDAYPTALLAVVGCFAVAMSCARAARELGIKHAAATVAVAASVGPWLAFFISEVAVGAALVASASAACLALFLRAEWPLVRGQGLLVALGLKPQPPATGR